MNITAPPNGVGPKPRRWVIPAGIASFTLLLGFGVGMAMPATATTQGTPKACIEALGYSNELIDIMAEDIETLADFAVAISDFDLVRAESLQTKFVNTVDQILSLGVDYDSAYSECMGE